MRLVRALVLIAVIALAVPQVAGAADMKHSLGLSAGYFGPTGDLSTNFLVGEVEIPATIELASTGVVGLAYQYRFNQKFSLGASLLYANPDFRVSSTEASGFTPTISRASACSPVAGSVEPMGFPSSVARSRMRGPFVA